MNYTLDTDSIRKRFAEAIVGIREDGTMAVLVPIDTYRPEGERETEPHCLNLVTGLVHGTASGTFPTLIRPGDRCEFGYVGDDRWWEGTYRGCRLDMYMFQSDIEITKDGFGMYSTIRPLPAPVAEVEPDTWAATACRLMEQLLVPEYDMLLYMTKLGNVLVEARAALERAQK